MSTIDRVFGQIVRRQTRRKQTVRIAAVGIGAAAIVVGTHYVTVKPGDSLSTIAARACGNASDWTGIYEQNSKLIGNNPDLILPGQHLAFKCNAAAIHTALAAAVPATSNQHVSSGTQAPSGSFQACVIARESGGDPNVMNASGHYGLYQFSESTWAAYGGSAADFGHASVAEQNQVFANAMAAGGEFNWSPYDGC